MPHVAQIFMSQIGVNDTPFFVYRIVSFHVAASQLEHLASVCLRSVPHIAHTHSPTRSIFTVRRPNEPPEPVPSRDEIVMVCQLLIYC